MKKVILLIIINITFLFSEDSFIEMCKNPTPSQIVTLKAMANKVNKYRKDEDKVYHGDKNFCQTLNTEFSILTYLPNANISDLSILKYFPDTPTLNLRNNNITDITPLKYLTKLTKLNLSSNKVSKGVESLENLPLKDLRISFENDLIDITPIGKIITLENLSLFNGKNSQALNNLKNVKDLSLSSVDIQSLYDLNALQSLERLSLFNNNLQSLECIDKFPNLKEVRIERSPITDLSPLVNAHSIKKFHFHDMPVEDISPLAKMKNLESILFTKTKIKYLSPLKESKSIKFAEDLSEMFIEEYFNRSLASCSPKSMKEVREGKSCFEADGKTLKPFWKRWLGL